MEPSDPAEPFSLGDVPLQCGVTLRGARLAFRTFGRLNGARDNVVLIPTYYGAQDVDVAPILDAWPALDRHRYFIVIANLFGNGVSTSPSNAALPFERGGFPHVTLYDNVVCQHRLLFEHLGVARIRLVVGFSMGAQQAFHWGALFPDVVDAIAPICGSARTTPHNFVFLEGVKAALTCDAAFADGWYDEPPARGLTAFSRVYAGWMYSQDFYREAAYRTLGLQSVDDVLRFVEGRFRRRDANNLLAMLWTWQHADISANDRYRGDLGAALAAIGPRAIVMPSETDLYFRVKDNEVAVAAMPHAQLRPIPSIWGHAAGGGSNPADNAFINGALAELLEAR
jgi:homoserine O-acetyltransferase